ncbi:MAG: alpha-E domain-containing protein [Porcipelethomonas sp.]
MGTISIEHGDRLFWLGRYTERVFSTLKALEKLYDNSIDGKSECYVDFLANFGLSDTYGSAKSFFDSFIFEKDNINSVAASLDRAYDNGIVLREEISTEALSFLQLAMDTLEQAEKSSKGLRLSLLPLEDILFGFWGCVSENVYDYEIRTIIFCGKSVERLDLYLRFRSDFRLVQQEFERLCRHLRNVPKNSPYRYNTNQLSMLVEILGSEDDYIKFSDKAISSLGKLFEDEKIPMEVKV